MLYVCVWVCSINNQSSLTLPIEMTEMRSKPLLTSKNTWTWMETTELCECTFYSVQVTNLAECTRIQFVIWIDCVQDRVCLQSNTKFSSKKLHFSKMWCDFLYKILRKYSTLTIFWDLGRMSLSLDQLSNQFFLKGVLKTMLPTVYVFYSFGINEFRYNTQWKRKQNLMCIPINYHPFSSLSAAVSEQNLYLVSNFKICGFVVFCWWKYRIDLSEK